MQGFRFRIFVLDYAGLRVIGLTEGAMRLLCPRFPYIALGT